jgi:site-specific DNA-methyltransferase (adenine-specific)
MKIVIKKVEDLIPYINNPRKNDDAVDAVASSIKHFGFKVPIVIDAKNEVIAGHTRLKAAKKLGMDQVPCIVADDLNENQIKAFRLADNKVSELAVWDDALLGIEMFSIHDIDLLSFGFDVYDESQFGLEFELPDGDKEPFQQMTFTLSDQQVDEIKEALLLAKDNNDVETYGNQNGNGNALYRIVSEWAEQKK